MANRPPRGAIRFAVIGFGALAERYYTPAMRRLPAFITAVADPLEVRRSAAAALFPMAKTYADYRDLLTLENVDGILVASPPITHLSIWNDASKHGAPVFMEKPFLLGNELSRAESSQTARRLLMVNFNRRFWPEYRRMGELARGGVIGELRSAEMIFHVDALKWRAATPFRLSANEGGVLYDLGSHAIDLIPHLLGEEPVSVLAKTTSQRWEADHVELSMDFSSGFTFQCSLGYQSPAQERLVIRGRKGVLRLDNPNMTVHTLRDGQAPLSRAGRCRDIAAIGYRAFRRDRSMLRYSVHAALAAFIDSLRSGTAFSPNFTAAANNAMWLEAVARSAASGKAVEVGGFKVYE
jgi:predicted dehydrogenase